MTPHHPWHTQYLDFFSPKKIAEKKSSHHPYLTHGLDFLPPISHTRFTLLLSLAFAVNRERLKNSSIGRRVSNIRLERLSDAGEFFCVFGFFGVLFFAFFALRIYS
jgi:hypothetical protein